MKIKSLKLSLPPGVIVPALPKGGAGVAMVHPSPLGVRSSPLGERAAQQWFIQSCSARARRRARENRTPVT